MGSRDGPWSMLGHATTHLLGPQRLKQQQTVERADRAVPRRGQRLGLRRVRAGETLEVIRIALKVRAQPFERADLM